MHTTVVERVCRIPIECRERMNISAVGLLAESGYLQNPVAITETAIETHLRAHPELITSWVGYFEDQRCVPAYSLSVPDDAKSSGPCIVGLVSEDSDGTLRHSEREFPNRDMACASVIKAEVEQLRQITDPRKIISVQEFLTDVDTRKPSAEGGVVRQMISWAKSNRLTVGFSGL
jgi:hypothetical protein